MEDVTAAAALAAECVPAARAQLRAAGVAAAAVKLAGCGLPLGTVMCLRVLKAAAKAERV